LDGLLKLKKAYLQQMFPQAGETVPRVRFEGFVEPWERCRFGDVANIVAGGDIDKSKLLESGRYPVIANALTNDGIVGYYNDDFRIEAPAVTVTGRGDVGFAQARKSNFTPVVRLLAIQSNFDVDFLANAINQFNIFVESTGVPQLTSPQLSNHEFVYPCDIEQVSIGSFLRNLDMQAEDQSKAIEHLMRLKTAYLQRLFV
jgi:type I restriction enzyme S subunit